MPISYCQSAKQLCLNAINFSNRRHPHNVENKQKLLLSTACNRTVCVLYLISACFAQMRRFFPAKADKRSISAAVAPVASVASAANDVNAVHVSDADSDANMSDAAAAAVHSDSKSSTAAQSKLNELIRSKRKFHLISADSIRARTNTYAIKAFKNVKLYHPNGDVKSIVWTEGAITFESDPNQERPFWVCSRCGKKQKYHGTSSIIRHLTTERT